MPLAMAVKIEDAKDQALVCSHFHCLSFIGVL